MYKMNPEILNKSIQKITWSFQAQEGLYFLLYYGTNTFYFILTTGYSGWRWRRWWFRHRGPFGKSGPSYWRSKWGKLLH